MTTRVLLFLGTTLHSLLVLIASAGVWAFGAAIVTHAYSLALPGRLIYGASGAAFILFAVPLGWFCMRKLGARRPWVAEVVALLSTAVLSAVVLTIGNLITYSLIPDFDSARLAITLTYVLGSILGGVLFVLLSRVYSHGPVPR